MSIRIRQADDIEHAHELHKLAFETDDWVGDEHTFWFATDEDDCVVGFASAVMRPDGICFLSRAGVVKAVAGMGLQRRLIRARVRWAKQQGAHEVITYVALRNYESMVNLLRCGFRFFNSKIRVLDIEDDERDDFHYLRLSLKKDQ